MSKGAFLFTCGRVVRNLSSYRRRDLDLCVWQLHARLGEGPKRPSRKHPLLLAPLLHPRVRRKHQ
jgi:hypothetical protein